MKLRLESRHFVALLLLLSALALALTIGSELGWGRRVSLTLPQPKPQKNMAATAPLHPEFALPPLEQTYTEVLARPLFVPTRSLPPPASAESPQSAMRKGQFILVGVILTKEKNIALLREIANGKVLRVEQGKEINGMLLEKLEQEKITLRQGDDSEEVMLKIQPVQRPAQAAPAPAPGAPGAPPAQPGTPVAAPVATPIPPSMQEFIARRRAPHGLPR
jgi:hypothetical protein